ncbi:MAG: tRNA threonylcarbamoyladenosine biosynthesis protein Gcp [Candidatus Peribacteria bacterium]|jgi:N6-L-threonylcarbamoyladenine synthase|nr:tRNA threonylcarbamoyladenosine biosynthesis protein Gcp [Candidatus Peribacteria bacterium]
MYKNHFMKTLAIETSCDDTSLAIITYEGDVFVVDQLLAYSQIADHQKFGGVLPEIASRLHSEKIIAILQNIGREKIQEVDFISVTTHPGLPGSLVVGKAVATMLAEYFQKPLVPVNHIYGHIFSILLGRKLRDITFPMVILTASGGHNDMYLVQEDLHIEKKGYSLDDASGEAFDKVSKMLGGPYPG